MTTEELKTMVFAGLAEKTADATPFEVLQALNSAQTYLVRVLDWRAIPEMVLNVKVTDDPSSALLYGVPACALRHDDHLELVGMMWEPNNKVVSFYEEVILQSAQIVSVQALMSSYNNTEDLLCADAGSTIMMSSAIGSSWITTDKTSIIRYKRNPTDLAADPNPDLNDKWHHHMVDYALADIWMKFGDKERSILYNNQLQSRLQGPQAQTVQLDQGVR